MIPFEATKGEKTFPAFKINLSDEKAWTKVRKPPGFWDKYLWQPLAKFGVNLFIFVLWVLSLIVSSGLAYGIQRLIDIKWPPPAAG
jgi:hypothetical protein